MKTLLIIAAVCTLALLTSIVVGQDQKPMPPGIPSDNWIPIGDNAGFVVTPGAAYKEAGVVAGYFLVWHGNSWKKLDSDGGYRFQPIKK